MRERTKNMKRCVEEAGRCELCGSRRSLEAHHIIPVAIQDIDSPDNLICVCESCHSKLTPRSLLTQIGLNKACCKTYGDIMRWNLRKFCSQNDFKVDMHDLLDWLYDKAFPQLDAIEYPLNHERE